MLGTAASTRKVSPHIAFEASHELCALLREIGRPVSLSAKTVLFRKGGAPKGVFLVRKGKVAVSAGDPLTGLTRIAQKGSLLGLPSTVNNKPYSLTACTVTDVELYTVQPQKFRKLLRSDPVVGLAIVKILSEEVWALRKFAR